MKKILLITAMFAVAFTGCKKNDDDNNGGNTPGNQQFKIGNTTFNAIGVQGAAGILTAGGNNGTTTGSCVFYFNGSLPTANGSYKIVGTVPGANEVWIQAATNSGGTTASYATTNNSANPSASITVNNGKVTVVVPEVWAKSANNDSVKISANVTQQ